MNSQSSEDESCNPAHALVEEAFELAEEKLEKEEVTSEDVVEVGETLKEATEHPEADIWVTITAEGAKNQCEHHRYPEGPYEYEPTESPRKALKMILGQETRVTIS